MQQAIYTNVAFKTADRPTAAPRIPRHWDLYGVLALMASSAAYGLFSLLHLA